MRSEAKRVVMERKQGGQRRGEVICIRERRINVQGVGEKIGG